MSAVSRCSYAPAGPIFFGEVPKGLRRPEGTRLLSYGPAGLGSAVAVCGVTVCGEHGEGLR